MIAAITPIDPRRLTTAERAALELIHDHELGANAGGYYGRPPHRVTRQMASSLIRNGLVRLNTSGPVSKLDLTGQGKTTHAVMVERRQRRQG